MSEKTKPTKVKAILANPASGAQIPSTPKRATAKRPVVTKDEKKVIAKKVRKISEKSVPKVKVVRDSFTMPQNDYSIIGELKLVCQKIGLQVKKSELLRAGLHALGKMNTAQLKKIISEIEQIKTGRPKKV